MSARDRGFSIILVLVSILVLTIVGTSLLFNAGSDHAAALARERSAVARQVAEVGLTTYALEVQPSFITPQVVLGATAGGGGGDGEDEEAGAGKTTGYSDILEGITPLIPEREVPGPPGLKATYVVWAISQVDVGVQLVVEGRIAETSAPTKVVARSRVSATITMASEDEGYSGTIGWTPRNTGVIGGGGQGYVGL